MFLKISFYGVAYKEKPYMGVAINKKKHGIIKSPLSVPELLRDVMPQSSLGLSWDEIR